jgi:hypothetical protein
MALSPIHTVLGPAMPYAGPAIALCIPIPLQHSGLGPAYGVPTIGVDTFQESC